MEEGDFFTRHSLKPTDSDPESPDFKGVSEKGVELAREQAKEILRSLEQTEDGTVMLIGGASDISRTKSTALVYGDEIRRLVSEQNRNDILVFLPDDLKEREIDEYPHIADYLADQVSSNPDKKIVIDIPLFIREFSFRDTWVNSHGQWSEYSNELLQRNDYDDEAVLRKWLETQGSMGGLEGPSPKDVAERQLQGLDKLRDFARRYIPDRPLVIGSVGHCWNLDVLAIYLANNGEVNIEAYDNLRAKVIGETEMIKLSQIDGGQVLQYGKLSIPLLP